MDVNKSLIFGFILLLATMRTIKASVRALWFYIATSGPLSESEGNGQQV